MAPAAAHRWLVSHVRAGKRSRRRACVWRDAKRQWHVSCARLTRRTHRACTKGIITHDACACAHFVLLIAQLLTRGGYTNAALRHRMCYIVYMSFHTCSRHETAAFAYRNRLPTTDSAMHAAPYTYNHHQQQHCPYRYEPYLPTVPLDPSAPYLVSCISIPPLSCVSLLPLPPRSTNSNRLCRPITSCCLPCLPATAARKTPRSLACARMLHHSCPIHHCRNNFSETTFDTVTPSYPLTPCNASVNGTHYRYSF